MAAADAAVQSTYRGASTRPFVVRNARVILAYAILIVLLLVYWQKAPQFTAREWRSISNQGMTLTIASLGQLLAVATGGIDLSVGSMVALSNCIIASMGDPENPDRSLALGIVAALAAGAFGGFCNGVLIAYGRLQPIIVTLASGYIFAGIALRVQPNPGGSVPFQRADLLTGLQWDKVPRSLFVLIALLVFWALFKRTALCTRIYAIGSNEGAAYMSGIDVVRTKIWTYTLTGFFAALAGVFLTAQTASGDANAGLVYSLNSIAAVVLGGASLAGGVGTFVGAIAGAYTLMLIPSVLFFFDFYKQRPLSQELYKGLILLAAVSAGALGVWRIRNRLERL
ncbi:MAG: ABC transporter permease [Thermomicrobiales bacterium]|nr:ABC transporter permease [Thermomicrobiales bacterium]